MYIPLATTDVWEIKGDFDSIHLFKALPVISLSNDVLVIGSYKVGDRALEWLESNESEIISENRPFLDSFEFNRREYPDGRFFVLQPGKSQIDGLITLATIPNAGIDKDLFFDHLLLYREGVPIVPLLNFHDAFSGGTLYLSGLYSEKVIQKFAGSLAATFDFILNPDLRYER